MALNLVRNSKVFFTTNVDSTTGDLPFGGYGAKNTFEIQVLDGMSFSQNTNSETVTLNESGLTPVRGQRSFNTSLAPVDFSFSTYIRPRLSTTVLAEESVLWNALFSANPILASNKITYHTGTGGATPTITAVTYAAATGIVTITGTNLPNASLAVNDIVVISGLSITSGLLKEQINTYGTVTTITSTTGITITLDKFTNTATTITTPTTTPGSDQIFITKQNISQTTKIGVGGTGTITTATYSYTIGTSTATGFGTITVVGTGMPVFDNGAIVVLSGFTGTVAGTGLSGTATPTLNLFNQPAVVRSGTATSTSTSLVLDVMTPFAGTATLTPAYSNTSSFSVTKSAWAENGTAYSLVSTASTDTNKLQPFGLLFLVDTVMYGIENCVLNEASIDFSIDGIATIAWTGQGSSLKRMTNSLSNASSPNTATATAANGEFGGTMIFGKYTAKDTGASYLTNKLSNIVIKSQNRFLDKDGLEVLPKDAQYTVAITGGNISINNNITYLTPELLGTVNEPSTYFPGTRAITGSLTAYLKTGDSRDTGELLEKVLTGSIANTEILMGMLVNIGGTTGPRIQLDMPGTILTIPTVDVQQVVSTNINFTAEGNAVDSVSAFDLTEENDLTVRYYGS